MKTTKPPPEPEFTLQQLMPLLALMYSLLEAGVDDARNWFASRQKKIHNVVFADMVRLRLFQELADRTISAGLVCKILYRPNVGIRVLYNGSMIAVWKADKDGRLPAVGASITRQGFYHQPTLLYADDGTPTVPRKLALLWERDSVNGLLMVKLVAPKGYTSFWRAGEAHWSIPVPHPAKTIAAQTDFANTNQDEHLDAILRTKKKANERIH